MIAKNRHKIRFWNDSYVQYGFTKVIDCYKLENAQCTSCNTILGNDSLTFKAKRARYDMRGTLPALGFCLTSQPLLRASYEVSLIITKAKAPHTAGEKLIKPCAVEMAQIFRGRDEAKE